MTNWLYSLGTAAVFSGNFGDELVVTWLKGCWRKSFEELENSDVDVAEDPSRWKRLDSALSKALQGMIKSSGESLSEDVTRKAREYTQRSNILRGRHIIWVMIDYFNTNRSLQEQYTRQDIETREWQGEDRLK